MNLQELDKALIGEIWTSDESWRNLLYLCDACGHRFMGSPGYRQAAEFVAERFSAYGLQNVALEPFSVRGWQRGPARLHVLGEWAREVPCIALPYCVPCDQELELLDLGTGTPEEIDRQRAAIPGKAVIVSSAMPPGDKRYIHRMEKYMRAQEAGARAFLFVNASPGDMVITGGLPERGSDIAGVGLSYESGALLSRLLSRGPLRARLRVESASAPITSWNVVGEIPGGERADEMIVVGGHLDSHDLCAGAADNASGIAMVLEAARALSSLPGPLARTARFVAFGVEELGLIGSEAYATAHAAELGRVQFMLNLDVAGANIANDLALQSCPEEEGYFRAMGEAMAYTLNAHPAFHPYSDHFAFVMAGVPAGALGHSGGEPRKGYAHTAADTVDKLSPVELRLSAMVAARIALRLAQDTAWKPAHRTAEAVRELLINSPFVEALRYEGRWPWAETK
ncbi:MAG: M28 family peptidase [Chloroflexi bacterium]|nr:M28 family peptidase [Chloroflexota bacterium]